MLIYTLDRTRRQGRIQRNPSRSHRRAARDRRLEEARAARASKPLPARPGLLHFLRPAMHRHDGAGILRATVFQADRRQRQQPVFADHRPLRRGEVHHSRYLHPLLLGDVGAQADALGVRPAHGRVLHNRHRRQQHDPEARLEPYARGHCNGRHDLPHQFHLPVQLGPTTVAVYHRG